jgi:hypothetical protein
VVHLGFIDLKKNLLRVHVNHVLVEGFEKPIYGKVYILLTL